MGEGVNHILSWSIVIIMLIGIAYIFKGIGKIKLVPDSDENNDQIKKAQYRYYAKPYVMTSRENECFKTLNEIFSSKWCRINIHMRIFISSYSFYIAPNTA